MAAFPSGPARALALALLAASPLHAQAGGHPLRIDNGGDALFVYSDPSVGPSTDGDVVWTSRSGVATLTHGEGGGLFGATTVEISAFALAYYDTDWSTPVPLHYVVFGPAVPSLTSPGNLEPDFFQAAGLTSGDATVALDGSPLPPLACPPPGYVSGYVVSFSFGSTVGAGVVVPADGTAGSDFALSILLPGGMTLLSGPPGACGLGDYVAMDVHSTDETQADDLGGYSAFGGFQAAAGGAGPTPDLVNEAAEWLPLVRERVLSVVADSGSGALECGTSPLHGPGGATNALKLGVGSGAARLSYVVHAQEEAGTASLAFAGTSLGALPPPGAAVLGGALLVLPDDVLATTFAATAAAGLSIGAGGFADLAGCAGGPPAVLLGVPAAAVGISVWSQGFVLETPTLAAHATNRVRTRLLP